MTLHLELNKCPQRFCTLQVTFYRAVALYFSLCTAPSSHADANSTKMQSIQKVSVGSKCFAHLLGHTGSTPLCSQCTVVVCRAGAVWRPFKQIISLQTDAALSTSAELLCLFLYVYSSAARVEF